MRRACHMLMGLAFGLAAVTLAFGVTRTLDEPLSPQSHFNRVFADSPEFWEMPEGYRFYWPPLYPSLLWLGVQFDVAPRDVNAALFSLTLLLLWLLIRWHLDGVSAVCPLALFAVAHFNYVNVQQLTAEVLALPLSLLLCCLVLRRGTLERVGGVVVCAAILSLLGLTRYFCVVWWLPIVAVDVLSRARVSLRRRALHLGILLAIVLVPLGVWLWNVYLDTGFLTGMDRFGEREGYTLRNVRRLSDFDHNLLYIGRTLTIDFFSTQTSAQPRAVIFATPMSTLQLVLLTLLGTSCLTGVYATLRGRRVDDPWRPPARSVLMLAMIVGTYYAATVMLWTVGNNDPIYTRFLFPSYPFLIVLGCCGHAWMRHASASIGLRLPWVLLYVGVVGVQCHRLWTAVAAAG